MTGFNVGFVGAGGSGGGTQVQVNANFRGAYDVALAYAAGDSVEHNGAAYIATDAIAAGTAPPASPWGTFPSGQRGERGLPGTAGNNGWTALYSLRPLADGRIVFYLEDYVGGQGNKPSLTNRWLTATGLASTAEDAIDMKGADGEDGTDGTDGVDGVGIPDTADAEIGDVVKWNGREAEWGAESGGTGTSGAATAPALSNFRLFGTAGRYQLDNDETLVGDQTLTITIARHQNVRSMQLTANGVEIGVPWTAASLQEGENRLSFSISQTQWTNILAADSDDILFALGGTDSGGNALTGVNFTIERRQIPTPTADYIFVFASITGTPDSIPLSAIKLDAPASGFSHEVDLPITNQHWFVIMSAEPLTSIVQTTFNSESLSAFAADTITISGVEYNRYALQNASGVDGTFNYRIVRSV